MKKPPSGLRAIFGVALGTAGIAIPFVLGTGAATAGGAGPNTPTPVTTGIIAAALPNAQAFGATPPDTAETVSFVLRAQNYQQLASASQRPLRQFLSVGKFASHYGQTPRYIAELEGYLSQYGISTTVYPDRLDLVANGTAGAFDSAFSVQQQDYHVPAVAGQQGSYGIPAQNIHGISSSPLLPRRLAENVLAVLGLTNYSPFVTNTERVNPSFVNPRISPSDLCASLCHLPSDFGNNYGLGALYNSGAEGQGQTLAIVTLASLDSSLINPNSWAPQDYWQAFKVDRVGTLQVDNVDGGPGAASDASGSPETDLDVEQAGGLAPDANVIVYQAPNADFGFADAFFAAASDNLAGSVASSWGESETLLQYLITIGGEDPGYEAAFDEAFMEMAMQGQSGFLASGDYGAYSAIADLGTTNLSTGASDDSPWITAVGGTTLPWSGTLTNSTATTNCPGTGSVTVTVTSQRTWGWDYLWSPIADLCGVPLGSVATSTIGGSGGGFSTIEPEPSYQWGVPGTNFFSAVQYLTPTDVQPVSLNGYPTSGLYEPYAWLFNPTPSVTFGHGSGRAEPDLSADADPYTGYWLYAPSFTGCLAAGDPACLQAGWGGTSFVAQQLNGASAVIDSALGHRVGFWNPSIYRFAQLPDSPFTPLDASGTGNDNLYYTGTPGTIFNEGSGLGYPNLSALAVDFGW